MPRPATGAATLLGLGIEKLGQYGVGAGSLTKYLANLPTTGRLNPSENPSGQINPSGFKTKGIPGAKGGEFSFGHPMTSSHMLEFYEHLLGKVTKTTLESSNVFQYVFEPDFLTHKNTSIWGLFGLPPIEYWLSYGMMIDQGVISLDDNQEVVARFSGQVGHGTKMGLAAAEAGNTGTYQYVPWVRGVPALSTAAGKIWVRIEDKDADEFKMLLSATKPTDPTAWDAATALTLVVNRDEDGNGVWQFAQKSDDAGDIGIMTENKDPLEIVFPGTAADFANNVNGDTWSFEVPGWSPPAITEITGATRYTGAHWRTRFRNVGDSTWIEKGGFTGELTLGWPVKMQRGNSSRYAYNMYREGLFNGMITLERDLVDNYFGGKIELHERIESRHTWEGPQLGANNEWRESIDIVCPSVGIPERTADPADPNAVGESISLVMETNAAGDPPCSITVITARDWTPTA